MKLLRSIPNSVLWLNLKILRCYFDLKDISTKIKNLCLSCLEIRLLFSNILNQSSFLIAFQLRRMDFFSSSKVLQYQNPVHNDKARNSESQRKCQRKQCDIKQNILPLNKPFIPSPFLTHILAYHNTELHRFFFFFKWNTLCFHGKYARDSRNKIVW